MPFMSNTISIKFFQMRKQMKYNFLLILLKYETLMGMLHRDEMNSNLDQIIDDNLPSNKQTKFRIFRMNEKEINEFFSSLSAIRKINTNLMQHLSNFQNILKDDNFCMHSLPSFSDVLDSIIQLRKNSRSKQVCEYEFIKFCELYYRTLYYIIKFEAKNLQIEFYRFSKEKILPILSKINSKLIFYCLFHNLHLLREKLQIQKTDDSDRCRYLQNFLSSFFESQNQIVTNNKYDQNCTVNMLISLCLNIFLKFFLCNRSRLIDFIRNFVSRNYLISDQFVFFLFKNGEITGLTLDARINLRRFLSRQNLDLEEYFLNQGNIPTMFDMINEYAVSIGLAEIRYKEND